jgi:hypothetical protein
MECNNNLADFAPKCSYPSTQGMADYLYVIKKTDWDKATKTITTKVVSAVTLDAGAQAYKGEVLPGGFDFKGDQQKQGNQVMFGPMVGSKFEWRSRTEKDNILALQKGRYVVIVRVNGEEEQYQFQVLGHTAGLSLQDFKIDTASNGGVGIGTFKNLENEFESDMPLNFWHTDLETTLSDLEALLTPTS